MTSSGIVSDCHFEGNFSRRGGGAYLAGGAVIEDSSFDSNTALGGGLFLANSFATRCSFSNNQGFNEGGGGMRVEGTGTVTECVFADNHGGFNLGGGGISIRSSTANIVDCAFLNNTGPFRGGGIYVLQASPLIRGCYFEGNSAVEGGGMAVRVDTGAPPQITDCVFESNTAQDFGGGLGLDDTRAEVLRCSFRRNFATIKGGGAGTWEIGGGGAVKFVSCEFLANGAGGAGGGLASDFHQGSGPTFVTNSLFAWNYAGSQGGGIRAGFGPLVITNCTIAFNVADSGGGLVVEGPIAKTVANSTLWGNSHFQSAGESANLLGANVFIDYSCVEGWTGLLGGTGNFSADPLFVNPCGCDNLYGTDDDDFRLQTGSPCANVGDDASVPTDVFDVDDDGDTAEALPLDLAGSARFVGAVDMGALEGTFVPDCGSNGIANNYCQTSPNSVDAVGAIIGYVGSLNLSDANLTLTSGPVASGSFGLFYYGPNRINAPFGDGFRCVGGNTSRLNPPVQADGLGVASRTLNFAAIPLASGPNAVFPGSTWNFQYWYRDGMAGMTGFNLSDGLSISFCP